MSGVITALRTATRAPHERLSEELDPDQLCATTEGYVAFLAMLHGFHATVEAALPAAPLDGVPALVPARTALLAADLSVFGVDAAGLPQMPALPPLAGDGSALGVVYVVEGSSLGGIVLAGIVDQLLGRGPHDGAAFFGAGAQSVERWRAVKAALDRELTGDRLGAAERMALRTFEQLHAWADSCGVLRAAGGR